MRKLGGVRWLGGVRKFEVGMLDGVVRLGELWRLG